MNTAPVLDASFLLSEYPYLIFSLFIFLEFRNKPLSPPTLTHREDFLPLFANTVLKGNRCHEVYSLCHTSEGSPCVEKAGSIQLSPTPAVTISSLSEPQLLSSRSTTPWRHTWHQKTHALKLEQPPFDPPLWNSFLAVRHWETLLTKYPQFLLLLMENRDKNNPIFRMVVWLRRDDVYRNF